MERKLASIQKVSKLFPIPGADFIEGALVLGWEFVVKKGEFKVGDLGVFFEVDSILPKDKPEFAFLEKVKWRIKTVKFKKQISQGLMIPISAITYVDLSTFKEGADVTEILGVEKHDPEFAQSNGGVKLGGKPKGNFPAFINKTDEVRIQSMPSILETYKGKDFVATEKLDGTSFTAFLKTVIPGESFLHTYYKRFGYGKFARRLYPYLRFFFTFLAKFFTKKRFGICSRNLELKEEIGPEAFINAYWKLARKINLEDKMRKLSNEYKLMGNDIDLCIQGEMIGPGIQENKYKLKEHELYIFNVFNIKTQKYFSHNQLVEVSEKLGIKNCPVVYSFQLSHSISDLVSLSKAKSLLNKNTLREGIVCRILNEEDNKRVSFKVVDPDFLLKYDK